MVRLTEQELNKKIQELEKLYAKETDKKRDVNYHESYITIEIIIKG